LNVKHRLDDTSCSYYVLSTYPADVHRESVFCPGLSAAPGAALAAPGRQLQRLGRQSAGLGADRDALGIE